MFMHEEPHFGGYMIPVRMQDKAREARRRIEGSWNWTPDMEFVTGPIKKVEEMGMAAEDATDRGFGGLSEKQICIMAVVGMLAGLGVLWAKMVTDG